MFSGLTIFTIMCSIYVDINTVNINTAIASTTPHLSSPHPSLLSLSANQRAELIYATYTSFT